MIRPPLSIRVTHAHTYTLQLYCCVAPCVYQALSSALFSLCFTYVELSFVLFLFSSEQLARTRQCVLFWLRGFLFISVPVVYPVCSTRKSVCVARLPEITAVVCWCWPNLYIVFLFFRRRPKSDSTQSCRSAYIRRVLGTSLWIDSRITFLREFLVVRENGVIMSMRGFVYYLFA